MKPAPTLPERFIPIHFAGTTKSLTQVKPPLRAGPDN
jgi:hypothetical protein